MRELVVMREVYVMRELVVITRKKELCLYGTTEKVETFKN
jgi:hypothetical protein